MKRLRRSPRKGKATNDAELDRMHLVTLATPDGYLAQRTNTTLGRRRSWPPSRSPSHPPAVDFTSPSS